MMLVINDKIEFQKQAQHEESIEFVGLRERFDEGRKQGLSAIQVINGALDSWESISATREEKALEN